MSCYSTATGTLLTTLTSESVSMSYSTSISSLKATTSTVISCGTATLGLFPVPTCSTYEATIGGGASTFQVPVTTTVTLPQAITDTLYGTTCPSGSSSVLSDSSDASSTSTTSRRPTASASNSRSSESSAMPTSTTIEVQTTETTVVGGMTVTTQVTSMEVVADTAATTVASVPTGSGMSGHSSNSNNNFTPDGAIIGAIVGGIAALVLLAFGFAFFLREKKHPDDELEKDLQPNTPMMARMLRKRQGNKNDLDLDAEPRPFTDGLPYHDDPGNQTMETIPPPPPQKENPPMRFIARLKPLPLSPRATWYSTRTTPTKHQHLYQQPQSNRSSTATIRPTPPPQLPQLTVDPPSPPPGQYTPFLHVANTSPRDSALLTPPPLPEKGGFMPLPRKGKSPAPLDGAPPPAPSRSQSPRSSFFGTPALRMPAPMMSPVSRSIVQHDDGGPAQAGPSSRRMGKAAEAASEARASGEMPPPAYSE